MEQAALSARLEWPFIRAGVEQAHRVLAFWQIVSFPLAFLCAFKCVCMRARGREWTAAAAGWEVQGVNPHDRYLRGQQAGWGEGRAGLARRRVEGVKKTPQQF